MTQDEKPQDGLRQKPGEGTSTPSSRKIDSVDLFAGHREVLIQHAGETYRLLQTRNGRPVSYTHLTLPTTPYV